VTSGVRDQPRSDRAPPKFGTYLYARLPALAFALELGFGILCWWVFRGNRLLLALIVLFNIANLSLFFADVPGPDRSWPGGRCFLWH
jgi:hypothetical protein